MSKVEKEVAEKEINGWLDCKRISESKRELQKDSIKTLVDAIIDGVLVISEDNKIVQELAFPIGEATKIARIEYKPRITVGAVQTHMEKVKSSDLDGRICAIVAALSNQTKGIIKMMDTEDYGIASSIAVFFL